VSTIPIPASLEEFLILEISNVFLVFVNSVPEIRWQILREVGI
jgi:hypothetical protein